MSNNIKSVEKQCEFYEIIHNEPYVLIDFYSTWCVPCLNLAPVLEEIAAEDNRFTLVKVQVDASLETERISDSYEVLGIPAVFLVQNEKKLGNFVGFKEKKEVQTFLNNIIL